MDRADEALELASLAVSADSMAARPGQDTSQPVSPPPSAAAASAAGLSGSPALPQHSSSNSLTTSKLLESLKVMG